MAFCELAAALGLGPDRILPILQAYGPAFPDHIPSEYDALHDYDLPLRSVCLQAALTGAEVTTSTLLPQLYRPREDSAYDRHDSERRRFDEAIGKILGIYKVRARAIVTPLVVSEIADEVTSDLSARRAESEHRWFRFDRRYKLWALRACDALVRSTGDAEALLQAITDVAERTVRSAAPDVWIDMAELLIRYEAYRPLAYRLLELAADDVTTKPYPGSERWQTLLRCAAVTSQYDPGLCQEYYQRGLVAAQGIDDDTALLLSYQADMAREAAPCLSADERRGLVARLTRLVEVHEAYVSDTSHLPWKQTLETVTQLDPPSGFALCSRWDDENRLDLAHSIPVVVRVATEWAFLSAMEGLALLRLAGERHDVSEDALSVLERLHADGAPSRPQLVQVLKMVSAWIRRDVPLKARRSAAARVVEWADGHGLGGLPGLSQLRTLLTFVSEFASEGEHDASASFRLGSEREAEVQELVGRARTASLEEVDCHLRAIWAHPYGDKRIVEYLGTLGRRIAPSQRIAFLETR